MPVRRPRSALLSLSAAIAVGSLALLAVPAGTAGAAPAGAPGNNGTVKIHEGAGEPAPETRNEPHVCTFHVHALFFDADQELTFTIQSWQPTGDRSVVLSGTITADGTGEGRTPGEYELPDGHYRLTVDTGNGAPTQDKHKMFWVRCESPTSSPSSSDSSGSLDSDTSESGSRHSGGSSSGSSADTGTPAIAPAAGAGDGSARAAAGELAVTGSPIVPIVGLGLALLLAGLALAFFPATRSGPLPRR